MSNLLAVPKPIHKVNKICPLILETASMIVTELDGKCKSMGTNIEW